MYFSHFPLLTYPFEINGQIVYKPIIDLTVNVRLQKEIINEISLYDWYDIQDGETLDILSHRFYNSSTYHWVLMLANDIYDYQTDYPMFTQVLHDYIIQKYTQEHVNDIHHWEKDGLIVDAQTFQASPVTNWEYETRLNDLKRRIKVIHFSYISSLVQSLSGLM
jgi:hypothetical protein